jgi:hypothetical protein
MLHLDSVLGVVAVVGTAILLAILFQLSPRARLKRRLKKTHSRIVSKSQRPNVKFSVKTPRQKKREE